MFMTKEEWSDDDELDNSDLVVPLGSMPQPQVLSAGGGSGADSQYRASAYNERMARARSAARKPSNQGATRLCGQHS